MTEPLLRAIIGGFVADYLLQNDFLAQNKKKSSFVCALHCFIWTICVLCFSGWICLPGGKGLAVCLILLVTHFIQDRTSIISWWMKLVGQSNFMQLPKLKFHPPVELPATTLFPVTKTEEAALKSDILAQKVLGLTASDSDRELAKLKISNPALHASVIQSMQDIRNRALRSIELVPGLGPWSIIVVDNVWHIVTLLAVAMLVNHWFPGAL